MSLLTIISNAAPDVGLNTPTSVIGNTDLLVKQLYQSCRTECFDLLRRYDWQVLTKETTFTTVALEQQTTLAAIGAADFYRLIDGSMFNRTQNWAVLGPLSSQEWQLKKSSQAQVGIRNFFRIRGDAILFFPTPTAGNSIYLEYISKKWCQSNASVAQADWVADSDTALIDEELIRLGTIWRFKKSKGLEYGEDFRTYEMALESVFGPDGARAPIDMTGSSGPMISVTIPEGNWPI